MNNAEALRALDELQGTLGYLPDGPYDRATDAVEKLRAHLTAPGYVRVPVEWRDFVRDVVESAEGYESRSGNKVNGDWVARGRALLTAAPAPADELAKLRARVKVLEDAISQHNAEMDSMCANKSLCGYAPYNRSCPHCPTDYKIEV